MFENCAKRMLKCIAMRVVW